MGHIFHNDVLSRTRWKTQTGRRGIELIETSQYASFAETDRPRGCTPKKRGEKKQYTGHTVARRNWARVKINNRRRCVVSRNRIAHQSRGMPIFVDHSRRKFLFLTQLSAH